MGQDQNVAFDIKIPFNNQCFTNLNAPCPGMIVTATGYIIGVSKFTEYRDICHLSLELAQITFTSPLPATVLSPVTGPPLFYIDNILYLHIAGKTEKWQWGTKRAHTELSDDKEDELLGSSLALSATVEHPGDHCYGTASCLISSHLINHASPILSNELSNTSVWLCYRTAPQPLILSL